MAVDAGESSFRFDSWDIVPTGRYEVVEYLAPPPAARDSRSKLRS
jgi:hypothetical protein